MKFLLLLAIIDIESMLAEAESARIDCNNKAFVCYDEKRFYQCVDFGNMMSTMGHPLYCPQGLTCNDIVDVECEYPEIISTTLTSMSANKTERTTAINIITENNVFGTDENNTSPRNDDEMTLQNTNPTLSRTTTVNPAAITKEVGIDVTFSKNTIEDIQIDENEIAYETIGSLADTNNSELCCFYVIETTTEFYQLTAFDRTTSTLKLDVGQLQTSETYQSTRTSNVDVTTTYPSDTNVIFQSTTEDIFVPLSTNTEATQSSSNNEEIITDTTQSDSNTSLSSPILNDDDHRFVKGTSSETTENESVEVERSTEFQEKSTISRSDPTTDGEEFSAMSSPDVSSTTIMERYGDDIKTEGLIVLDKAKTVPFSNTDILESTTLDGSGVLFSVSIFFTETTTEEISHTTEDISVSTEDSIQSDKLYQSTSDTASSLTSTASNLVFDFMPKSIFDYTSTTVPKISDTSNSNSFKSPGTEFGSSTSTETSGITESTVTAIFFIDKVVETNDIPSTMLKANQELTPFSPVALQSTSSLPFEQSSLLSDTEQTLIPFETAQSTIPPSTIESSTIKFATDLQTDSLSSPPMASTLLISETPNIILSEISTLENSKPTQTMDTKSTTLLPPDSSFSCAAAGQFPDHKSCSTFHLCINAFIKYVNVAVDCPKGTLYDSEKKVCTQRPVQCPGEPRLTCITSGVYQHPNDCSRYYKCFWRTLDTNFDLQQFRCPREMRYDSMKRRCVRTDMGECETAFRPTYLEQIGFGCTEIGRFAIDSNCEEYYECQEEEKGRYALKVKVCPSHKLFDREWGRCRRKHLVICPFGEYGFEDNEESDEDSPL